MFLGVEKNGLVEQLTSWFSERGLPVLLALGGSTSQTYVDDVVNEVDADGRPAVLLLPRGNSTRPAWTFSATSKSARVTRST